jgi:enoyl-CoA hydratase/carnithine racemase
MGEFISIERASGVAVVRMDRPPMNALNLQMQRELQEAATEISGDESIRAAIVYGGPKVFAAGADIKEMVDMSHTDMVYAAQSLHQAFYSIASIPQPTIAAINGYALGGGCEVALCCDLRIAAEDATLGLPEVTLGIIPGAGGTQRLPRLIGASRAKDLILTGRFVRAPEAADIGLVNRVVPADSVLDAAREYAERLARGAGLALRAAKLAIDAGLDSSLDAGLALERTLFAGLFATEDRARGMESFVTHGPGKAEFISR